MRDRPVFVFDHCCDAKCQYHSKTVLTIDCKRTVSLLGYIGLEYASYTNEEYRKRAADVRVSLLLFWLAKPKYRLLNRPNSQLTYVPGTHFVPTSCHSIFLSLLLCSTRPAGTWGPILFCFVSIARHGCDAYCNIPPLRART